MTFYGSATEAAIATVIEACKQHGSRAIIALAGVPGTGKSFAAAIAAQRVTGEPLLVREIQFHQSFAYEEFIEGMRIGSNGSVVVEPGVFLEWNNLALQDEHHTYVLLIEELTRANLPSVLGELLTYVEHRDRPFLSMYSRQPILIAKNLIILATYNPIDKSALELDAAVTRRLRIIAFPPSPEQLAEMLSTTNLPRGVIEKLEALFSDARAHFGDQYETFMPFGHGVFAEIDDEQPDLYALWNERLRYMLRTPRGDKHPYYDFIAERYPWRDRKYAVTGKANSIEVAPPSLANSPLDPLVDINSLMPPTLDAKGEPEIEPSPE